MANEEKFVITLDVDGQEIMADNDTIYSGIVGALKIKLNLINWIEENTVVRFFYGENEPIDIIVSGECVDVPQNVIRSPGFTVALGGYKSEGYVPGKSKGDVLERFVPTNAVYISVARNGYGSPDAAMGSVEDVPSLEGQLIALARTGEKLPYIGENGNWFIFDVENKVYIDSGKASRGLQGVPGDDGYTPQRGTDYWTEEDKTEIVGDAIAATKEEFSGIKSFEPTKGYNDEIDTYTEPGWYQIVDDTRDKEFYSGFNEYQLYVYNADTTMFAGLGSAEDIVQYKLSKDGISYRTRTAKGSAMGAAISYSWGEWINLDLTEYVKNTDYATPNKAGVVKVNNSFSSPNGIYITADGILSTAPATEAAILQKVENHRPITPKNLEYAVQSCTNQDLDAELTEEQLKLPPSTQAFKDAIGDIDTALDSILAIQNSYI